MNIEWAWLDAANMDKDVWLAICYRSVKLYSHKQVAIDMGWLGD